MLYLLTLSELHSCCFSYKSSAGGVQISEVKCVNFPVLVSTVTMSLVAPIPLELPPLEHISFYIQKVTCKYMCKVIR